MTEREVSSERVSEERALSAMIDWVKAALQCKDWIWDGDQRDAAEFELAEAEKALLALRSSVKTETRVKALEWELLGDDSWRAPALFFGSFRVENYARGYIVLWSVPGIADTFVEGRWPSAEAAKAAAQSDYERRILSTIEAPSEGEADPDDEAYEIGKRDGYDEAVQDIDRLTGGDGEYRFCTDHDPDRHTPDAEAMKRRIVERFNLTSPTPQEAPSEVTDQALRDADTVSLMLSQGKRIPRVMTEDLRNHVRKLAAALKGDRS